MNKFGTLKACNAQPFISMAPRVNISFQLRQVGLCSRPLASRLSHLFLHYIAGSSVAATAAHL